jgi:predicted transcriptional regulator
MVHKSQPDLVSLTADIVSAFVANNSVKAGDLAAIIAETHEALASLGDKVAPDAPAAPEFKPAVSARKSLSRRDAILSMIDGKPYRTLKRHLAGHGLTPDQYRERYGLAKNYPMVAPDYSEMRRAMAVKIGLGQKGRKARSAAAAKAPARRGRRPVGKGR